MTDIPPFHQRLRAERNDMHTETITITPKWVNGPKEGGKMGNLNCMDGRKVFVWPDKLHLFEAGREYTMEVTVTPSEDPSKSDFVAFSKLSEAIVSKTGVAAATPERQMQWHAAGEGDRAENIYVAGVTNSFVRCGGLDPADPEIWGKTLLLLGQAAQWAYRELHKDVK